MRRRAVVLIVAVLSLVAVACDFRFAVPPGDAPLRYRDPVFSTVTKTSDVTYGRAVLRSTGQPVDLKLDVYEPAGDAVTARPAVVWVHGGSFSSGNKSSAELVDESNVFAQKGFVNVSIDYRLSPTGCSASAATAECVYAIIDAMHDAQAAVRFLRANATTYRVDPTRIAIGGTSAGAITALNVGFDATDPGDSGNPGYSSAVGAAVSLSGAHILGAVDSTDAPSLLFHGTADLVVPYQWAVNTVNDATAAGLTSYLTSWEGDGHVPYVKHRTEILDQTTNFLYWMLRLHGAAS